MGPDFSASTLTPIPGNAIQAFGNGTDVNVSPKGPSFQATQAPRVEKTPSLPDDLSDSTSLGTSVITTCTSVQVRGVWLRRWGEHHGAGSGVGNDSAEAGEGGSSLSIRDPRGREELPGVILHSFLHLGIHLGSVKPVTSQCYTCLAGCGV